MKRTNIIKSIFAAVAMAATSTWADTETVGGYTWTYRINGDTAEIYGYGMSPTSAISPSPTGAVTIPSTLGGRPVTRIGNWAFYDCSGLTSVTIPDSVTSIGDSAFYHCSGLTSVTIPDGVTSIGDSAFYGCTGLTSVTIPDGVTSIGYGAFSGCSGLTSVTIGNGVTSIVSDAFSGCSSLTGVTIPGGVTSIGYGAFYGCSGLASVTIPNSVTSIGSSAFSGCSGLTSVTIGNSVTSIGWHAFSGCSELTSFAVTDSNPSYSSSSSGLLLSKDGKILVIVPNGLSRVMIPDSVIDIDIRNIGNCFGRTEFVVTANNPNYKTVSGLLLTKDGKTLVCGVNGEIFIPDGVTDIGDGAFAGCSSLTSVTIPNSVTNIGESAFESCIGLTSVTIPDSVMSIEDWAFDRCIELKDLVIGGGLTRIEEGVFDGCTNLTSVTIPANVMDIDEDAFEWSCLTNITLPARFKSFIRSISWSDGDCSVTFGTNFGSFYDVVHTVVFDANGGMAGVSSMTWCNDDNAMIGTLPAAWRPGYAFDGWYTARDGGERISGLTRVTCDATYYAHWTQDGSGVGGSASAGICACADATNDCRYALADAVGDRTVASLTVDSDCAIDEFILKDGKVYDSMLRIVNTSANDVHLTLPSGYTYETFEGVDPLTIPANSRNILSITRTEDKTFLVSREKLKTIK